MAPKIKVECWDRKIHLEHYENPNLNNSGSVVKIIDFNLTTVSCHFVEGVDQVLLSHQVEYLHEYAEYLQVEEHHRLHRLIHLLRYC